MQQRGNDKLPLMLVFSMLQLLAYGKVVCPDVPGFGIFFTWGTNCLTLAFEPPLDITLAQAFYQNLVLVIPLVTAALGSRRVGSSPDPAGLFS